MTLVFGASLWLSGCGGTVVVEPGASADKVVAIGEAYEACNTAKKPPPKGPDDLAPYLPEGKSAADVFTDDVVVIWGVDLSRLRAEEAQAAEMKPFGTVVAYEKDAYGERMAFTTMGPMMLSDEDFKSAKFAGGHKP